MAYVSLRMVSDKCGPAGAEEIGRGRGAGGMEGEQYQPASLYGLGLGFTI
jgi:hypothetical protein